MSNTSAPPSNLKFSPTAAVRNSSRRWMEGSLGDSTKTTVSINHDALDKFADEITASILANQSLEVTEWDADGWHYTGNNYLKGDNVSDAYHELMRMERVALYILTLDAINFCFWPLSSSVTEKGGIAKRTKNGLEYEHLAIALRKIAEADDGATVPADKRGDDSKIVRSASSYALSPLNLSTLTPTKLQSMLQPHFPPSSDQDDLLIQYELPNMEVRCQLLNELGNGLLQQHDGSALHMISKANKSADSLVGIILDTFPGFRDFVDTNELLDGSPVSPSCDWEATKSLPSVIHFYKRAQIATADVWAALGRGVGCCSSSTPELSISNHAHLQICQFNDMDKITTFPDYRVPQILRHVDVLQYEPSLAQVVDDQIELEKSSVDEVSIRAGTVVAVEEIVQRVKGIILSRATANNTGSQERPQGDLQKLADDVSAVTVDWYLWQQGEKLDRLNLLGSHHRVRTTFY